MLSSIKLILLSSIFLLLSTACAPPALPDGLFDKKYDPYSSQAVQYFKQIALGAEFNDSPSDQFIKKWNSEIRIQLHGSYTTEDKRELTDIISELKELTGLSIQQVTRNANVNIYFIASNEFSRVIPYYNDTSSPQIGLFHVKTDPFTGVILNANITVKESLVGDNRKHILREELTQSLGLMKDSYQYTNSIFQQSAKSTPIEYARIDKEVIRILYDPRIRTKMTAQKIEQALLPTT